MSGLEPSDLDLPDSFAGEWEEDYNRRAGAGEGLFILDKVILAVSATEGRLEPCDLLHIDGVFAHVKRYKHGSADLSHLFAQAAVSALTFLREPEFRGQLREALVELGANDELVRDLIPEGRPDPGAYEVAYVIIAPDWPEGATSLPFFAKLTLMRSARQLDLLGFQVSLTRVRAPEIG